VREQLAARLQNLLQGFWLVPGVVAVLLAALGLALVEIDDAGGGEKGVGLFPGDAQAARVVLSVVAGSLITVAGLAFSITIVTLQLVSSQYTPRALRSLLGDRTNQVVAGAFVGIFAYCLLVLRSVRVDFVPSLAVTGAIVLGLVGLALLLVFIHHVGQTIKVDEICARVMRETMRAAERLYPEPFGAPEPAPVALDGPASHLHLDRTGWVRTIAVDRLAARLAEAESVEVLVVPGDFVTPGRPVAAVRPPGAVSAEAGVAFEISSERDLNQDVGFGVRQLADIALRALSPSLNDPTTAVTCVGYLGAILERLAGKGAPEPDRRLGEHGLLVRAAGQPFERLLGEAFLEIGRHGQDDPRVVSAVLDALELVGRVAAEVGAASRVLAVREVAAEVSGPAVERARTDRERAALTSRADRVQSLPA
jgi:uncharacterized membrane protein